MGHSDSNETCRSRSLRRCSFQIARQSMVVRHEKRNCLMKRLWSSSSEKSVNTSVIVTFGQLQREAWSYRFRWVQCPDVAMRGAVVVYSGRSRVEIERTGHPQMTWYHVSQWSMNEHGLTSFDDWQSREERRKQLRGWAIIWMWGYVDHWDVRPVQLANGKVRWLG